MDLHTLLADGRPFLAWLVDWYNGRPQLDLSDLLADAGGPPAAALLAVDVTAGFCHDGPLASSRVGAIVPAIRRLFERARALGVSHFLLPQDTHSEDAVEFGSYPAHCVRGSPEAQTVPELATLPFSGDFVVFEKDSISSDLDTDLGAWLDRHPEVTAFLVAGDCTDLCVYHLAMFLRLRANVLGQRGARVIVPANAVDTYDLPVDTATSIGAMPHAADLLHLVFLYSMAQNGVEIVRGVV